MLLSLAFVASVVLGRIALDGFRVPLGFLALLDVSEKFRLFLFLSPLSRAPD